jgi:hypothetical protein
VAKFNIGDRVSVRIDTASPYREELGLLADRLQRTHSDLTTITIELKNYLNMNQIPICINAFGYIIVIE